MMPTILMESLSYLFVIFSYILPIWPQSIPYDATIFWSIALSRFESNSDRSSNSWSHCAPEAARNRRGGRGSDSASLKMSESSTKTGLLHTLHREKHWRTTIWYYMIYVYSTMLTCKTHHHHNMTWDNMAVQYATLDHRPSMEATPMSHAKMAAS